MILLADLETDSSSRRSADGKAVTRKRSQSTYRAATTGIKAKRLVPPEDPFGRTTLVSGTNLSDKQYAGMYFHQVSGLYLTPIGNTYDPNTGRWIGRDPLGEEASLNLYAYVDNDPINEFDPLGLTPAAAALALAGGGEAAGVEEGASAGLATPLALATLAAAAAYAAYEYYQPSPLNMATANDDSAYKPSNRDKVQNTCNNMGGEDPDPFKGKGPKKGTKEYEKARRDIEKAKEKSGRGGKDNIDPANPP